MFCHPKQLRDLVQTNLHELAQDSAHWRLATEMIQAQSPVTTSQPHTLNRLLTYLRHLLRSLTLPMRVPAIKHH